MALPIHFSLGLILSALSSSLDEKIKDAAMRAHLDHRLVEAIIQVESNFNFKALSPKGAQGLMQVMPSFSDECEIRSAFHPVDNLMGACDCLRRLINRYRGNLKLALAAYNAGPSQVDKFKGVPPFKETKLYVERVLKIYRSRTDEIHPHLESQAFVKTRNINFSSTEYRNAEKDVRMND